MTNKQKEAIKVVLDSVNSGFLGCEAALVIIEGIVDGVINYQYIPYTPSYPNPNPLEPYVTYGTQFKVNTNGEME